MSRYKITKGLDLPIAGEPEQVVEDAAQPSRVAWLADDYVGMKPTMHVREGDVVRRGQLLFEDKKTPEVRYTAPAGGTVVAVNRGERRALQSVVIELDETERGGGHDCVSFEAYAGKAAGELGRDEVKSLLIESGLWTAIRRRPFSKVADPTETPEALFVTVADTNPLAPDVGVVLKGQEDAFEQGLTALGKLLDGPVHVCKSPDVSVRTPQGAFETQEFEGPHPAGAVGTHIHFVRPVTRDKVVWHIGYQDVIAIGKLVATGALDVSRIISLAGPAVEKPRLLRTRLGASTTELVDGELEPGEQRVLSGSVLAGRKSEGEIHGFLGRYHNQITALPEGRQRELLGWLAPGFTKFSTSRAFISSLFPGQKYRFTTNTNGSSRAMVPIGLYENVVPLDILPTFLLRALLMQDIEKAEELGVLELDEEDLALCTFVCPGKSDYGPLLRQMLTTIEKEG